MVYSGGWFVNHGYSSVWDMSEKLEFYIVAVASIILTTAVGLFTFPLLTVIVLFLFMVVSVVLFRLSGGTLNG